MSVVLPQRAPSDVTADPDDFCHIAYPDNTRMCDGATVREPWCGENWDGQMHCDVCDRDMCVTCAALANMEWEMGGL